MLERTRVAVENVVAAYRDLQSAALIALGEYNRIVGEEFGRGDAPLRCYNAEASRCDEFTGVQGDYLTFQGMYGDTYELCRATCVLPISVLYEDGWAERMRRQCIEDERVRNAEIAELRRLQEKYPHVR